MICLPSYKILRADEADDRVHQQRLEAAGHGVGAGFERLLIDAVMRLGREAGALPGLEIHHVVAERAAAERLGRLLGLFEQLQIDAEAGVGGLGAGDRLKHQIDRRAALDRRELRRDVGQHARLRRNLVALDQLVEHVEQADHRVDRIGRRIDADHRVAAAVEQAIEDRRADADQVVGRMIRLQPNREPAGQAERVAKARDDAALAGHQDQVLIAHQLADGGDHFRRQPRRQVARASSPVVS